MTTKAREIVIMASPSERTLQNSSRPVLKNLFLIILVIAILAPTSIKVANISIFDWLVYPFLVLILLKDTISNRNGSRIGTKVVLGFLGLFFAYGVAFLVNINELPEQFSFVRYLNMSTEYLGIRLLIYGIATMFLFQGAFLYGARYMTAEQDISHVVYTIIIAGTINAIYSIMIWIIETGGIFGRYNYLPPIEQSQGVHDSRMMLIILLAFAVLASRSSLSNKVRIGLLFAMLVSIFSMATVLARGNWIETAFYLSMVIVFLWKRLSNAMKNALMVASIIIFIGIILSVTTGTLHNTIIQQSFRGLFSPSSVDITIRIALVRHAVKVFLAHPIVGVGYGFYVLYSTEPIYITSGYRYVATPHNGAVLLLAELGSIGAIFFIGIVRNILDGCIRAIRYAIGPISQSIATVFLVILIGKLIMLFFANSFLSPPVERAVVQGDFILWFFFGMCTGIAEKSMKANFLSKRSLSSSVGK